MDIKKYTIRKSIANAKGRKILAFIATIALILSSLLILSFIFEERKMQFKTTEYRLNETTERDAAIVQNIFDGYIDTLLALSVYLKSSDDLASDETMGFLRKMAEAYGFERLSIDFPHGKSYTTDGHELSTAENSFLESVNIGQIFITDLNYSSIDGTPVVRIQVPIHKDSMTVASLGLSLKREELNNQLKEVVSGKNKYFYLIDGNGEYVAFDAGENNLFSADANFFDSLDIFTFGKGFGAELIMQAFTDAKAGHTEYSVEGVERYGYYAPIGINKWVIMSVTSKNVIDSDTDRFLTNALTLLAQILLIFLVIAYFIYLDQKKARETVELDEQCFRILAEHTGKVVLEWDYSKKEMYYPNFEKTIGQKPLKDILHSADEAINAGAVHPEDCDIYKKMFSDIMNGNAIENLRLRMRAADEDFKHYSISSVVVRDTKGKPYKSIGFLENIELQIQKEKSLQQKANTDQLTGFYNKSAAEVFITEALSSSNDEAKHALMCIDLDNFKGINDNFGHLYGDEVLKEISEKMNSLFRASDILGRFGGDEFVVFIRDIPSIEFVKAKAAGLNKRLNITYRQDNDEYIVSASIGIAIFPIDGNTYEAIYKKADEASYVVKNAGRNSYSFASNQLNVQGD